MVDLLVYTNHRMGDMYYNSLPWLCCLWHSSVVSGVPGWPARSGSVELGTSRVVGKQGERGEAKLSTRQIRLETR